MITEETTKKEIQAWHVLRYHLPTCMMKSNRNKYNLPSQRFSIGRDLGYGLALQLTGKIHTKQIWQNVNICWILVVNVCCSFKKIPTMKKSSRKIRWRNFIQNTLPLFLPYFDSLVEGGRRQGTGCIFWKKNLINYR